MYRKCGASTGPISGAVTVDKSGIFILSWLSNGDDDDGIGDVLPSLTTLSIVFGLLAEGPPKYGMFQPYTPVGDGIINSNTAPQ